MLRWLHRKIMKRMVDWLIPSGSPMKAVICVTSFKVEAISWKSSPLISKMSPKRMIKKGKVKKIQNMQWNVSFERIFDHLASGMRESSKWSSWHTVNPSKLLHSQILRLEDQGRGLHSRIPREQISLLINLIYSPAGWLSSQLYYGLVQLGSTSLRDTDSLKSSVNFGRGSSFLDRWYIRGHSGYVVSFPFLMN